MVFMLIMVKNIFEIYDIVEYYSIIEIIMLDDDDKIFILDKIICFRYVCV